VAADIAEHRQGSRSIWIFDIGSGVRSRVTFAGSHDWIPVWSPDGSRILFSSFREGPSNFYQKPASGEGGDRPVFVSNVQKFAHDWSPDGRYVAYMEYKVLQEADIVARRVDGTGNPIGIAQSNAIEFYPRFSPDGRWIAYGSAESGRNEVYVQPFPPTGGKWQISSSDASHIRWRADGRELFYMTGKRIVAVDVTTTSTFAVGPPRTLFQVDGAVPSTGSNTFEPAPDGKRFLFNMRRAATTDNAITVVLNWTER
jgi:Tol biopolymer transport system component